MISIYNHGIHAFLLIIIIAMIYWAIKLDKIQDYRYEIYEKKKLIMRSWSEM